MKKIWSHIILFSLLISPTIFLLVLLVNFFPYTGLARIITIPGTIILNSVVIVICLAVATKKSWVFISKIVVTIFITILITIAGYPQEFNPSVITQTKNAIHEINQFEQITRDELNANGDIHNPRYVVALYKFRDEIPLDGTYQLYQHENVYFYDYSINDLNEIGPKLIGYHKAMWWYLKLFKD